ncbi:MAG: BMC domain-containing protein [Thermoanaerobaculia bacterium]
MKSVSALAVLEFEDIPSGVWAVDAIVKKAPIAFVRAGTTTRGRYLVVFGGSMASTAESYDEALATVGGRILDRTFLPDVHPSIFDALAGKRANADGSLLIIETETACSIVRAVEAALKGTPVELVELRLSDSGLSGKGLALLSGTLHDVEAAASLAAVGAGVRAAAPRGFSFRLIAAPHEVIERDIAATTDFQHARMVDLDGEAG